MTKDWRLDTRERGQLAEYGFVVRRDVFDAGELAAIGADCEALVQSLLQAKRNAKVDVGSVVFFGPFLVQRSLRNRSADDRRALLFSYQPAGHPHLCELLRLGPPAGAV